MSDVPEVEFNGRIYDGWQKCAINMSIKDIADSFALTVDDFSPASAGDMSVKIVIGDDPLLNGWLDDVDTSTVPDREGTRISGRSKAGDLVDCSAIVQGGELRNLTLLDACRSLCQPFGIGVTALTDTGARFDRIKIEQGETVSQVVDRISRERGFNAMAESFSGDLALLVRKPSCGTDTPKPVSFAPTIMLLNCLENLACQVGLVA